MAQPTCQTAHQRPGPISRMPTELLAEIFLQYAGNEPRFSPDPCYPSVLTGRVCRQWRSIVFSTPQLWTAIEVAISDDMQPAALATVCQRFGRSGACPLMLRILIDILNEPITELGQQALDFTLTTAHRWQTAELHVTSLVAKRLFDRRPLRLPLMQCLTIRMLPNNRILRLQVRFHREHLWDLLENSPLLRTLNINDPEGIHCRLVFPWTQLTSIHIKNVSVPELSEILGKCPNLVRCTYGSLVELESEPHPIDQIQLTQLRSLDFQPFYPINCDFFVLPALESLTLRGRSGHVFLSKNLAKILERVQTTLLILRLHITLRLPDFPMILRSAPNLVEFSYLPHHLDLYWFDPPYDRLYIGDFYSPPGGEPSGSPLIVPNLQRLTLGGDGRLHTTPEWDWCIGVVRARWDSACENVSRLRYVRFCFGKEWGGERVSREVDALREEGLDIELLDAVTGSE